MAGRMSGEAHADEARVTAWLGLSELFLDTEHDDGDIARIRAALAGTGFDIAELERIYENEVAPVCWRNLSVVPGGAWAGFDRGWLVQAIMAHRKKTHLAEYVPIFRRFQVRRNIALSKDDWRRVKVCSWARSTAKLALGSIGNLTALVLTSNPFGASWEFVVPPCAERTGLIGWVMQERSVDRRMMLLRCATVTVLGTRAESDVVS